jgi:toxin-antitoxin system PIN domain toxin
MLVDVGVWLAAIWARHAHHEVAAHWFDEQSEELLLCRLTQLGILRLVSNPTIMGDDVVSRTEAWRVVDQLRSDERVVWADEPPQLDGIFRALSARADTSHQLWTDDYLAAFAQAIDARLASLDTRLRVRYPSVRVEQLI